MTSTKRNYITIGLFIAFSLFFAIQLHAQSVDFLDQVHWNKVKKVSKAQKKPIFVDVYTEYCAPCKWMDENVFNDPKVADFVNKHFVSVKYDAEKGHGKKWVRRPEVGGFPTYLFINRKDKVVYSYHQSTSPDQFITVLEKALERMRE
jgi:thiol:disulfide interchange protein